jgi:hypothetical protein
MPNLPISTLDQSAREPFNIFLVRAIRMKTKYQMQIFMRQRDALVERAPAACMNAQALLVGIRAARSQRADLRRRF